MKKSIALHKDAGTRSYRLRSRQNTNRKNKQMLFKDEEGFDRQFTWSTIQTWYSRYKKDGITGMKPKNRMDLGQTRKIKPEELMEAINEILPIIKHDCTNKMLIYRKIIEKGIISIKSLSQTSFYRFVREYELLKNDIDKNKEGVFVQSKLIAFIDNASRVLVHGQFFLSENTDTPIGYVNSKKN